MCVCVGGRGIRRDIGYVFIEMFLFPFCLFPNMSMVSTLTKFFTPRILPGSTCTAASPLQQPLEPAPHCQTVGPVASPSFTSDGQLTVSPCATLVPLTFHASLLLLFMCHHRKPCCLVSGIFH